MILVAASNKDVAGVNIANQVLKNCPFTETAPTFQENPVYIAQINKKPVTLITLKEETICAQTLPEHFADAELIIFLSRHSSQSGKPTLSVHTPGNFAEAELGGLPRTVSVSPATAMQTALKALMRFKTEMHLNYEVSYECTHHGPSLNVPTMFVELGSSPQQWNDQTAAEAVAKAAIEAIARFQKPERKAVVGIGGTHYNQRFTQMALNDEAVFGHMIPKYAILQIDTEILQQCIERTLEKTDHAILDWKGIRGDDKPKVLETLAEIKLPYSKV
jgi:D-aminoacyl-tRNA deacylase